MSGTPSTSLALPHGPLPLPAFLPDATRGVVRCLDAADLEACGIRGLMMNTLHLAQAPGASVVRSLGGLHAFCGWKGPIVTDSGGFQAWSLLATDPRRGHVDDRGLLVRREGGRKLALTPERCIEIQWRLGADALVALDQCTAPEDPADAQETAVRRTVEWARRSRAAFDRLAESRDPGQRPLLLAVIQGGRDRDLRRRCAEELLGIGFDGFGFGGWPIDAGGGLIEDLLGWVRELIPPRFPLHALGIGRPESLLAAYRLGYQLFDCTAPTREARHGRLLVETIDLAAGAGPPDDGWFRNVSLADGRLVRDHAPVAATCDCPCCRRYSAGYVRHLWAIKDPSYGRLATLHNLRFMTRLMERLCRAG